jgi:hypothetical protein
VTRFRYPSLVEVRRPRFKRSGLLAHLDVAKLTRATRAELEVGHFEGGCCRKIVLAVVRRGIVTALRLEGCAECKPVRLTPELKAVLKIAGRRIGRGRDRPFRPMPVSQFIGRAADLIIEGGCSEFCIITILGYSLCVICCKWNGARFCVPIIKRTLTGALIQ